MIRAIVFDMGGVLAHEQVGRARLAEFDQMLGWERGSLVQHLYSGPAWIAYSTGAMDGDDYWATVGAPLEASLPPDFVEFKDNFWGATLDLATVEMAWRLNQHYRIALLSNATPLLSQHLMQDPHFQDLFEVVVISAHVGMRKPDPAIFHFTAQLLDLPLSSCVLLDDKLRNTRAAEAEGMLAIEHRHATTSERVLRRLGVRLD
ncbi:MAG: HAD family phosphatase [Halieaceae bacterium]|nr:HAD family phosphatase [Halieaceae bacterium]